MGRKNKRKDKNHDHVAVHAGLRSVGRLFSPLSLCTAHTHYRSALQAPRDVQGSARGPHDCGLTPKQSLCPHASRGVKMLPMCIHVALPCTDYHCTLHTAHCPLHHRGARCNNQHADYAHAHCTSWMHTGHMHSVGRCGALGVARLSHALLSMSKAPAYMYCCIRNLLAALPPSVLVELEEPAQDHVVHIRKASSPCAVHDLHTTLRVLHLEPKRSPGRGRRRTVAARWHTVFTQPPHSPALPSLTHARVPHTHVNDSGLRVT